MEGSFVHNTPNSPMLYGEVLGRGENNSTNTINGNSTDTAGTRGDDTHAPDLINSDTATLTDVVPDWASQEKPSDAQLMLAVSQGECAALEKLYDRYVQNCFGLAMSFVHEPPLAEEIVQDVFVKLWSRPDTFSPDRGNFHSWLITVVRNRSLDHLRQARTRSAMQILPLHTESPGSTTLVDIIPDTTPTPHDQAWSGVVKGVVHDALTKLPVPEYQVITLAYFGGYTQQEIAHKLHQPLGTVKTRTRSALRRLHNLVESQGALSD